MPSMSDLKRPKTHMCPYPACDAFGYEGDVCDRQFMHKGEPHGPMVPIPKPENKPWDTCKGECGNGIFCCCDRPI